MKRPFYYLAAAAFTLAPMLAQAAQIPVNVTLNVNLTPQVLAELGKLGKVNLTFPRLRGVTMTISDTKLDALNNLDIVDEAVLDADVPLPDEDDTARGQNNVSTDTTTGTTGADTTATTDLVGVSALGLNVSDFSQGICDPGLDAMNLMEAGSSVRNTPYTGDGVYVAVIDHGLHKNWRAYFPEDRIASEFARAIDGGGANGTGAYSSPQNRWELSKFPHGNLVVSNIIGYALRTGEGCEFTPFEGCLVCQKNADSDVVPVNGVAPKARIIPVMIGHPKSPAAETSQIIQSITYITDLKQPGEPLEHSPVVISMSVGSRTKNRDPLLERAFDDAAAFKIPVVVAAGNENLGGMVFSSYYSTAISVGAAAWTKMVNPLDPSLPGTVDNVDWDSLFGDVADDASRFNEIVMAQLSSVELAGQDLDVIGPSFGLGVAQNTAQGQYTYSWQSGFTSFSTPRVAGLVALMLEKNPYLTPAQIEQILEDNATPLPASGSAIYYARDLATVSEYGAVPVRTTWFDEVNKRKTGNGFTEADRILAATPEPTIEPVIEALKEFGNELVDAVNPF
ncbi:MAG: S8 family serine peptidase [Planctomycetaceae bacterium]|nr:S8 family serine peptidase [Planctomycetaceae bacterium]